ncbi:MAG: hypothetical protein HMLKMBBP_00795 [Planctomycetes bacterium]|nr:hypothetical protein [Planctomycetota bacterium]
MAPLLLVLRPASVLADKPFVEDSYYALTVARNLGTGLGMTSDGERPANGFQPLWVVLNAPLYAVAGGAREGTLRLVLAFQGALIAASAWFAAGLARSLCGGDAVRGRRAAWIAGAAWLASPHLWRQSWNGLETGLYLAALGAVWTAYLRMDRTRVRSWLLFGALCGLSVLARIDAVFLVILLSGAELLRGSPERPGRIARAAAVGGAALLVSSWWWIWNLHVSGSVMPTSGQATGGSHWGEWSSVKLLLDAAGAGLAPPLWAWSFGGEPMSWARIAAGAGVLALAVRWAMRQAREPDGGSRAAWLGVSALFAAALGVWYLASSRMNFFYPRYMSSCAVLGVPVLAAWIASLRPVAAAERVLAPAAALAAAACASGMAAAVNSPDRRAGNVMLTEQTALVRKHVPPGEGVAAFQSGTLGYFVDRVVNLDGKLNADLATKGSDFRAHLRERGIRWFCDDATLCRLIRREVPGETWSRVDALGQFELWRRE